MAASAFEGTAELVRCAVAGFDHPHEREVMTRHAASALKDAQEYHAD
jgi:hypothetical protein